MIIKLNFGALRRTTWHEYLARFILGGLITALTGWLASTFGPGFGGLFLAFPAIFPASATLLEKHEREKKQHAGITFTVRGRLAAALDARGALMGAIGGMVFGAIAWKSLAYGHPFATLGLAVLGWLGASSLLWYARKHHPWARPRRAAGVG